MNVPNSSCSNCDSVSRGPCSSTTTEKPAVDNSFARMPPAAPEPTITKSTMSVVRYRTGAACCATSASPVHVGIVVAERRLESRLMIEPDQVPSRVVAITAPRRQREHADDGVETERGKERCLLDLAENLVLL